jgi:hypothetical protein
MFSGSSVRMLGSSCDILLATGLNRMVWQNVLTGPSMSILQLCFMRQTCLHRSKERLWLLMFMSGTACPLLATLRPLMSSGSTRLLMSRISESGDALLMCMYRRTSEQALGLTWRKLSSLGIPQVSRDGSSGIPLLRRLSSVKGLNSTSAHSLLSRDLHPPLRVELCQPWIQFHPLLTLVMKMMNCQFGLRLTLIQQHPLCPLLVHPLLMSPLHALQHHL